MRKDLLFWAGIIASVAGYFFLLDFVRPALEDRALIPLWWAVLGLYVTLVLGSSFWQVRKSGPVFAAGGFLLIAASLYLYDPTIGSHLESIGLSWLWIVPLTAFFLWLLAFVHKIHRREQEKTRDHNE